MKKCVFDSSIPCPFDSCVAGSIYSCNVLSGRITSRSVKRVSKEHLFNWRVPKRVV